MNVIIANKQRREQDNEKINIAINQVIERQRKIDRKEFVFLIMQMLNLSRRTAQDSIDSIMSVRKLEFREQTIKEKQYGLE